MWCFYSTPHRKFIQNLGWSPVGIAVYAECFLRGDACYVPYQDLMPYCCAVGAGKAHLSFGCHLLENVVGLLSHDRGRTFGVILSALYDLGYLF